MVERSAPIVTGTEIISDSAASGMEARLQADARAARR